MECSGVSEALPAYLDHELTAQESLAIENHLTVCMSCRALFEQQEKLLAAVKKHAVRFTAPPRLEDRIRSVLRKPTRGARRLARWMPQNRPAFAAALVAVAAVAWTIGLYSNLPSTSRPETLSDQIIDSHVRALIVQHTVDVSSSDRHAVKPWFNGKLDFSPPVKDFGADFPLVGGRLDYFNHRPAAALVYRRRAHIITVFVSRTEEYGNALPPLLSRRGYHLFSWRQGEMDFSIVSDLNVEELTTFKKLYSSS